METTKIKKTPKTPPKSKKARIQVSKVYWKKRDYKELVNDRFNLN